MPSMKRVPMPRPRPHTWDECVPVVLEKGQTKPDMQSPANKAIRKIFFKLPQLDRIKFHQATCQGRTTPMHDAVMEKIAARLDEAGVVH